MTAQAMGGTAMIIRFSQRRPGLLAAAMRSALGQEAAGPITVVVCDDAPPSPAGLDLAMLTPFDRDQVILIRPANGGCACLGADLPGHAAPPARASRLMLVSRREQT